MTKSEAIVAFNRYIKREYSEPRIIAVYEDDARYLIEFIEDGDDFPVDYPVISIMKKDGKVEELSILDPENSAIIYSVMKEKNRHTKTT